LKIQKKLSKRKIPHFKTLTISSLFTFLWVIFALLGRDLESGGTANQEPDLVDQNQCGCMRLRIQLPICNTGKNSNYSYGTDTIKAEKKNRKNNFDAFTPVVTHPRYVNFVTGKNSS
jgi:hypothetical protein